MNKVVPETDSTHLKKAVEYIYENASEEITIAKLADIAGCSIRSLHRSFRTQYASTPMQLLRQVRLDKARRDLSSSSSNESVTAIALNCGFLHFGRFSKYYAERFGELPSETKRNRLG
jgi:transcriptional regulator GlxA family with amidase domain